jgi:hypothetical protein
MLLTYQVYEIKDNRTYDTVGPSCLIPVSKPFETPEDAVNFIKKDCGFTPKYTILPIYEVTGDDFDERYER